MEIRMVLLKAICLTLAISLAACGGEDDSDNNGFSGLDGDNWAGDGDSSPGNQLEPGTLCFTPPGDERYCVSGEDVSFGKSISDGNVNIGVWWNAVDYASYEPDSIAASAENCEDWSSEEILAAVRGEFEGNYSNTKHRLELSLPDEAPLPYSGQAYLELRGDDILSSVYCSSVNEEICNAEGCQEGDDLIKCKIEWMYNYAYEICGRLQKWFESESADCEFVVSELSTVSASISVHCSSEAGEQADIEFNATF
ncbi:MAG: hypothetical protein C4542_08890 [Dehalococcoidia bacterium]|nr:MAG: hypothetical protein C4542_08890 [Dehalococcoidia bacterium]